MNSDTLKNRRTKRTTVTLEADVADYISQALSQDKELKEKQLINKLLRSGIKSEAEQPVAPFKIRSFKSSLRAEVSLDDLERLLDEV